MALSCSKNFFCRITSKHDGDFYCLNYLHLFRTENKLKEHENVCENHDYCCIEMPKKGRNILKYHHGEKAMKVSFIIYVDTESYLKKQTHGIVIFKSQQYCALDTSKNKQDYYRGKGCMKSF